MASEPQQIAKKLEAQQPEAQAPSESIRAAAGGPSPSTATAFSARQAAEMHLGVETAFAGAGASKNLGAQVLKNAAQIFPNVLAALKEEAKKQ